MNRRILYFTMFLLLLMPVRAFAETIISTTTVIGGASGQAFTPSNNVLIWVDSHPTDGYFAHAWHANGNRQFGTDHNASKIYWIDSIILPAPHGTLQDHINGNFIWASPWKAL